MTVQWKTFGSYIVYLYHGNKIYRVLCEVADSKGHMILGRKQALVMEYVSFPEIQKPAVQAKTDRSIKTLVEEPAKTTNGPVIPRVQKCTDPVVPVIQKCTQEKITVNGKTHSKEGEDEEDFIPAHMLTEEIPADSTRIEDFREIA